MFTPSGRRALILPKQAAQHEEMIPGYGPVATPELPSFVEAHNVTAYLPGLEPEPAQIPTLLALYDRVTSGEHRVGFNNIHFRIFLMALITMPVESRNGRLQEAIITIRQLVEDWLGWQATWYRLAGSSSFTMPGYLRSYRCPAAILLLGSAFLHLHQPVDLTILDLLSTHLSAGLCTRAAISGRMATSGGDVALSQPALLRPVRRCHPIHLSVREGPCSGSRSCRCSA